MSTGVFRVTAYTEKPTVFIYVKFAIADDLMKKKLESL